ncbi:MAG: HNH endonuclease [Butyrivibrio sp.]|nr:HNH endonuclease [Butyrivibrio sp.]
MGKSKRTKACEFSKEARRKIWERDRGCIFCRMGYELPAEDLTTSRMYQVMHFIPRSRGGLGIPENGAIGCVWHHGIFDNGAGSRQKMSQDFENYLKKHYRDWDMSKLVYSKWRGICS